MQVDNLRVFCELFCFFTSHILIFFHFVPLFLGFKGIKFVSVLLHSVFSF